MMEDVDDGVKMPSIAQCVRGLGALIGMTMMIFGVVYAVRIFGWIVQGLQNPEKVSDLVKRWGLAVGGGANFDFTVGGESIPLSEILGILILGMGMWVLSKIAFMFLTEGSKVITNTLGEKDAIKKILLYTFGAGSVKDPNEKNVTSD